MAATMVVAGPAFAVPKLQLYSEGGFYDQATETWVAQPNADREIILWVIGNQGAGDGSGGGDASGNIIDVRLAISFDQVLTPEFGGDDEGGLPIIVSTARMGDSAGSGAGTGTFGGFADSWTDTDSFTVVRNQHIETKSTSPIDAPPDHDNTVTISSDPVKDDTPLIVGQTSIGDKVKERSLPPHDAFFVGRQWQEYALKAFDFSDTARNVSIADFNGAQALPDVDPNQTGQIFVYSIDTAGFEGVDSWHFDAYGVVAKQNDGTFDDAIFAPFSHDAAGTQVPEPQTLALLGVGLLGLVAVRRRRPAH